MCCSTVSEGGKCGDLRIAVMVKWVIRKAKQTGFCSTVKCWCMINTLHMKLALFQQRSKHVHLWETVCNRLISEPRENDLVSQWIVIQIFKISNVTLLYWLFMWPLFLHTIKSRAKFWLTLMSRIRLILNFWNNINTAVRNIMSFTIMLSPDICLFQGINELTHKAHLRKFLHLPVLAGKRDVVKYWKPDKPFSFQKQDYKCFLFILIRIGRIV